MCYRRTSEPPEPVQQPPAGQEEEEIADGFHQSPDIRVREAISVPEIPVARRQGRDRQSAGLEQRASDHVVSEQTRQTEARHGGTEEGCGVHQDPHSSQVLPRKRARPRNLKEEIVWDFCNGA